MAIACAGSGHAPLAPSGTLEPGEGEVGARAEGPFRVVFAGPEGAASAEAEITIVFDRALRALDAASAEAPPITVTPRVPGRFRWLGARALVFAPERGRLPAATAFKVEVPASVRAADGSVLGQPYAFELTTERPRVVRSIPADGDTSVLPTATLTLELNQAVDPRTVERVGTLTAAGKPIAFSVRRASADATKKLVIEPRTRLPLDAEIRFTLSEALTGEEGPLPAGKPTSIAFRTYGPLRVAGIECNRESPHGFCEPASGVGVSFNNPVRFGELKRAVSLVPAVPLRYPDWQGDDATTSFVQIPAKLEAGKRYELVVQGSLRDVYGQTLGREYRAEIRMDDYFPRVAIGLTEGTLLARARAPIPLAAVNAPGARVRVAPLGREDVARLATRSIDLDRLVAQHPAARDFGLPAAPARNALARTAVDSTAVLGPAGLGVLGLTAQYRADPRDYGPPERTKLAKISDVGITAKLSRHGSLVWLTRLSTNEPLARAEVELFRPDGTRLRYVTDSDGFAEIPAADYAPNLDWGSKDLEAVLVAAAGDDWNYERVADVAGPWASGVPVDLSGALRDQGLLFTDRGVYRPGDTVRVKGIVRRETETGSIVPKGLPVTLSLRGPSGDELRTQRLEVSEWGTFDATVTLPPAADLGSHQLAASLGRNRITTRIAVEEYRPLEFAVEVTAPRSAVRGDRAVFGLTASTLYGVPLADAAVRYTVTRALTAHAPEGTEGLVVNADAYTADLEQTPLGGGPLTDTAARLDARGALRVEQALALPGQRSPELVTFEAEVTDVARTTSAGRASVLVHPAAFYVALEPIDGFVHPPTELRPRVLAVSPEGKRLRDQSVTLELVRRRWKTSGLDTSGTHAVPQLRVVDSVVARCQARTAADFVSCPLRAAEAGYHLVVARATDARGNAALAAVPVYVLGDPDGVFPSAESATVELVPDKKTYRVGETARILVKSPFPEAEALLTVERAGVLHRERRSLRGGMPTFEIPVTEQHRPNAFVAVHLLAKPSGQTGPKYRFGYVELKIDPEEKRLAVDVTPSARELRPGAELTVDIAVRDGKGNPQRAELTVYAVDEGVLRLTGYRVPDPLPVFTATRPVSVGWIETRSALARVLDKELSGVLVGSKGQEGGGGGDEGARSDFRQTAYFDPSVPTDARGRARVRFRLPDSVTRYRVMAVAVGTGERFGFGESSVTASKRLMLRPALPRFFRTGDRVSAGVIVSTKDAKPGDAIVRVRAEGLALEGEPVRRVRVGANTSEEVRFELRAPRSGNAVLRFDVESGAEKDAVIVERRVVPAAAIEATALSGSTDAAIVERLGNLSGLRPDVGGLEVTLAPSALAGLERAAAELSAYPYDCTEQVASRLVPFVVAEQSSLARPGEAPPKSEGALVRALVARQRGDGGFGFFADANESHPWVSAYALWVLHAARDAGFEVPKRALESGREYLRRLLAAPPSKPVDRAVAALALDVLALAGEPDLGYTNRLLDEQGELPLFARALALSALANGKGDPKTIAELVTRIESSIRVGSTSASVVDDVGDAYAVLMDSEARTQALVLRALAIVRPNHPLLPALARGLLAARRGGTWRTTQESAFALIALAGYRAAAEPEGARFDARVLLGDAELGRARFTGSEPGRTITVAMDRLQRHADALLRFEREGRGTLFYEARLRYARTELPRAPLDAGYFIEKTRQAIEPEALARPLPALLADGARAFQAGALVVTDVVVVSAAPRDYVVIDDPLPAGFEAIQSAFVTTASRSEWARPEEPACPECERDAIAEGRALRTTAFRREIRDDRVAFVVEHLPPGVHRFRHLSRAMTPGTFVVPPSRIEGLYEPEIFGRTAAETVEIR
nr:MAG: hypothetical protein DIU78_01695 [Pseudomonadota bacterium]